MGEGNRHQIITWSFIKNRVHARKVMWALMHTKNATVPTKISGLLRRLNRQRRNLYCADFIFVSSGDLIAGIVGNLIGWCIRKMKRQPHQPRRHRIGNPDSCSDAAAPGLDVDKLFVDQHQLPGIGGWIQSSSSDNCSDSAADLPKVLTL